MLRHAANRSSPQERRLKHHRLQVVLKEKQQVLDRCVCVFTAQQGSRPVLAGRARHPRCPCCRAMPCRLLVEEQSLLRQRAEHDALLTQLMDASCNGTS